MKPGDLVKRSDTFKDWLKHNAWMTLDEEQEVGIITKFEDNLIVVLWSTIGISWEDPNNLELVSETNTLFK